MRRVLIFCCIWLIACALNAQELIWPPIKDSIKIDSTHNANFSTPYKGLELWKTEPDSFEKLMMQHKLHRWRLGLDVIALARNAEYFMPFVPGYTAIGYMTEPRIKFMIARNAQLTFGVTLTGMAGNKGFINAQPLLRMEYAPARWVRLILGTIYGSHSHELYEPMYNMERFFMSYVEEGFQILNKARWIKGDTWINWENLLEPWEKEQEMLTAGTNQRIYLLNSTEQCPVEISIPLSFLGTHRGGQFTALDTCIESLFNESIGLTVNWAIQPQRQWLSIDVPYFAFQNGSPTPHTQFENGWGVYPHLTWQMKMRPGRVLVQLGYWHGYQYIASRGGWQFQSVAWADSEFNAPDRRMLTGKVCWETIVSDIFSVGCDIELYHDIPEKETDIALGLYMRLKI